jgi:hypothetical protein
MARLRLSGQRAFLGLILPSMRLVKASFAGDVIVVTCLMDQPPDDLAKELVSEAAAEIIADYPTFDLRETVVEWTGPLPKENLFDHGWIYSRYEP